jgi:VanZ family protein
VVWALVIFIFSSIPGLATGTGSADFGLRKIAHVAEFAVLAALLYRALRSPGPAFALSLAYAASDELHQHFTRGREGKTIDVVIDAAGIAVGLVAWTKLQRRLGD